MFDCHVICQSSIFIKSPALKSIITQRDNLSTVGQCKVPSLEKYQSSGPETVKHSL